LGSCVFLFRFWFFFFFFFSIQVLYILAKGRQLLLLNYKSQVIRV